MNWQVYYSMTRKFLRAPYVDYYLGNRHVLDAGCGEGVMLARYNNWHGIDIDQELIRKCQNQGFKADVMSVLEIKFPDSSFDGVHAAQLIEHFPPTQALQFLHETSRILKPGGFLLLTTPGIKRVWNTFSHIRPYPPISLYKLLNVSTESYLGKTRLPLQLFCSHATRSGKGFLGKLAAMLDPVLPASDPDGWIIVCKKI
jgi:SAM-dependent methyltransferase